MDNCTVCGGPKGGIGIPIYGDPRCIACLRAADRAEAEARGEKYERWQCSFGWDYGIGGSSCTGTNWEWTRNQIVNGLTCKDGYYEPENWNKPWRWDWVQVDGPGMSQRFTRKRMPGKLWGDVVEPLTFVGKIGGRLRQVLGMQ